MPVETRKGSMLCAFVLQKQWALLGPELLQISIIKMGKGLYNQPLSHHLSDVNKSVLTESDAVMSTCVQSLEPWWLFTLRSFLHAAIPQQN